MKAILFVIIVLLTCVSLMQFCLGQETSLPFQAKVIMSINAKHVIWADYARQQRRSWPYGGIVVVTMPNCPPCDAFKKNVLSKKLAIDAMNRYVVCLPAKRHFKYFTTANFNPPFIMSIAPGGNVIGRKICPIELSKFLAMFPKEKKDE